MKFLPKILLSYLMSLFFLVISLLLELDLLSVDYKTAFSIIESLDFKRIIGAIAISLVLSFSLMSIIHMTISLFAKNIKDETFENFDFLVGYVLFSITITYNLLNLLTEEQFSLLSTVIALPLFVVFPRIFKLFKGLFKHRDDNR